MGFAIEVLGPLRVRSDAEVPLTRSSHRRLLSVLVLDANRRVATETLIDRCWGGAAPPTAKAALQTHISALRKLLPADTIATEGHGYRLDLDGHWLDLVEFDARAGEARQAACARRWQSSMDAAEGALALWRGPPYAELEDDDFAQPERARLQELRLELLETRAEALLGLGRNDEALPDLERLTREHPLRERLWQHLMTARYRAGRHAEALDAYREAWAAFAEIGLEPSAVLRRLEQKILLHDEAMLTAGTRHDLPVELSSSFAGLGGQVPRARVVGRVAELAALDEFLTGLESGFAALELRGEPGIGKTALWLEGVRRAEERGAAVLVTRPAAAEVALSFAGLADLLATVDETVRAGLSRSQRQALAAALLEEPAPDGGIDERAVSAATLSLLRLLAAEGPVLLAVDDVGWLDRSSAAVLAFATRRLDEESVGLLVTHGAGAPPPAVDGRAGASARRTVVDLGPLSAAELRESIKLHIGTSLPRPLLVQISRVSGGNPLYALEIARELTSRPLLADGRVPIPTNLGALVEGRVRRLPAATRRALVTSAAVSHPTIELVDPAALGAAEEAGMVRIERGRVRFTHPLFASAVYEQTGAPARRRLHRRLAELVVDDEERARHLALSSNRPDSSIASRLDAAALRTAARGAQDAAADLAELAIRLTPPDDGKRAERLFAAAGLHFHAGDLSRATSLLEELLTELPDGPRRAEALQMLGHVFIRRGGFVEAHKAASDALVVAGDDRLRSGIEQDLAFYCFSLGDFPGAESHAREAVELAERLGGGGLSARPLAVLTVVEFLRGRGLAEERMARALFLDDGVRSGPLVTAPRYIHGLLQLWTGQLDQALATLDGLQREALEQGRESDVPFLFLYLVWACIWRGDLAGAAAFADQSRETAALLDDRLATALALTANALVGAYRGPADLAQEQGAQAIAAFEHLEFRAGTIWPLWALGLLELGRGNPAEVDALLGPLSASVVAAGLGDPVLGIFLPDEIEALVELGRLNEADALIDALEEPARRLDRPWALAVAARCRGLLYAARKEHDAAIAALHEALAEHERLDLPLERARTLLMLGRALRRARRRSRARDVLAEAGSLFEQAGATLWAGRAAAELDDRAVLPPKG